MVFRSFTVFPILWLFLAGSSLGLNRGPEDLFSQAGIQPIKSRTKAPNFSLPDLEGRKRELKHHKGSVVFLNFWATWCRPCTEEMASMEEVHKQFKGKDFVFLAVSVDYGGAKPVREFVEKRGYTFPVLVDSKGETLDLFKVKGIPTTFIIDRAGYVIGKAVGPRDWKKEEIAAIIDFLLSKRP